MGGPRPPGLTVIGVAGAMFCDSLLYSVVVPVLPIHAAQMGISAPAIGVLFASYALLLALGAPVLGLLGERIGHRRQLIGGVVALGAATLLFAAGDSYGMLLAARSLQGLAAAAVWTSGIALVAIQVPPQRLGASMGIVVASMSAGLIAGPPVGGLLVEIAGYRAPFVFCAAVVGVVALGQAFLVGDATRPARPEPIRPLLADRGFRRTLIAVLVGAATFSMLEPLLPLDLTDRLGAESVEIGVAFGVAALVHMAVSPLVGALADRRPQVPLVPLGLIASGLVLPLLVVPDGIVGVTVVLTLFAVAYSFVLTPALAQIGRISRAHGGRYAAAYGAFNMMYALGMLLGPIAGAAARAGLSMATVLLAAGVLQIAAAIVLLARRTVPPAVSTNVSQDRCSSVARAADHSTSGGNQT